MSPLGVPTSLPFSLRRGFLPLSLCSNPFQQHRCRFVVAAFAAGKFGFGRRQFAAERLGQDRLRQLVGPCRRSRHLLLNGVGQAEQGLDAAEDSVLLGEGRKLNTMGGEAS